MLKKSCKMTRLKVTNESHINLQNRGFQSRSKLFYPACVITASFNVTTSIISKLKNHSLLGNITEFACGPQNSV